MFKVEENLQLTKIVVPDSYVIEDCKNFVPELEGFYVCLPKACIEPIKSYMAEQPNSSFIIKTFENDLVNGLNLLLKLEKVSSYTEEFVKFYGSVQGIFDAFSAFIASENVTDGAVSTAAEEVGSLPEGEPVISDEVSEEPTDFVDDAIFSGNGTGTEDTENSENNASSADAFKGLLQNNESFEELLLMIRGMACKLGVIDYDDSNILTMQELKQAQLYISKFSEATVAEATKGALSLVETREDLVAVTRFMELFCTYIQNNNLKR